ncbi:MAG TPA: phosphate/phosphite/phosphonate ABC transporter substrate-binding protein [Bacteroidetes bacterium]|nr:phosphate/phosphite/phosphonate ABC transporter substrate-binding protein [Bacteroidota bacterium]HRK04349.1 phosphate/phosphite/phosphonate ABC transporter substrate-binding protein [Chlorobiota bacterium]
MSRLYLTILLLALGWLTIRPLFHDRSLGSAENPIRVMLTPSVDAREIIQSGDVLARYLTESTGYHVRVTVPNDYIAVVESFGTARADVAIMNTFSYLLAHSKYRAQARLKVVRRDGEQSYRGEFIVRADAGIHRIEDLQGKSIAYVDPSSTSGYIYPKELLRKAGVEPAEEVFAKGHNQVVLKVYQKDVDAGAVFYSPPDKITGEILDARAKVSKEYPDIFSTVKILSLTEEIPNDPVVVRADLPEDMKQKIIAALLAFQTTPQGKESLMKIASVEGFVPARDMDYDEVRVLVKKYGVKLEK